MRDYNNKQQYEEYRSLKRSGIIALVGIIACTVVIYIVLNM